MVERAREQRAPGLTFLRGSIEELPVAADRRFELVFSNAALHWVDDHPALFSRLLARLRPGGLLAVQVPANHVHASHRVAFELAGEEPFRTALGGWRRVAPVLTEVEYALLLERLGCRAIRVRTEVYLHELDGPEDVVEWMRGTTLTAYERRLDASLHASFVSAYRERLLAELEASRPFPFPFRRTLLCARRGDGRTPPQDSLSPRVP